MRGLKFLTVDTTVDQLKSHLTRVRGLKYSLDISHPDTANVAPYTGAWIEILSKPSSSLLFLVAPYTGAWIEID